MRCLLCSAIFNTDKELIQHYVSYHRVDANNRFFQKLFQQTKNSMTLHKCLRWNDFITTRHYKIKHDFLMMKAKLVYMKISHLILLSYRS